MLTNTFLNRDKQIGTTHAPWRPKLKKPRGRDGCLQRAVGLAKEPSRRLSSLEPPVRGEGGGGGGEGGDEGEGRGQRKRKRGRALTTRRKRPPARQPQAPSAFLGWPRRASVSGFCPGQAPARRPGAHVDSAAALRADTVTTGTCEHVRCRRGSEDAERRAELACSGWVRCACHQPPPHSPCPSEGRRVPSTPPADCGINKGPDRSPSCPRCF